MSQDPAPAARHNLFFALSPDAVTRNAIAASAEALRGEHGDIGRWLRPPRYHLTLQFLGAHATLPVDFVQRAVAAAGGVQAAPFSLALDLVGSFGARHMPVWIGCAELPRGLRDLHHALEAALRRNGIAPEHPARFVPHVTILQDATRALHRPLDPPIAWRVDEFALIDSEPPSPYRVVGRWPLA